MNRNIIKCIVLPLAVVAAGILTVTSGCKTGGSQKSGVQPTTADTTFVGAEFDADTAFAYVEKQVDMGPRVAGTEANERCAEMIADELMRHGADTVTVQRGMVTAFNGDRFEVANVMGSFNSDAPQRVLLMAHYDTRPWADNDDNPTNRALPIPGANDGASGVAVLLEVARQIGSKLPAVGVDMLFVDGEDYGESAGFSNHDESWALGTQLWTRNMPYAPDSMPRYAILLDMVGGMGAKFHREYYSNQNAQNIVDKVWSVAARTGFGDRFPNLPGGAVVDDHLYVQRAGIPAIDIIESKNSSTNSFNPTWHTMADDVNAIDATTLKAVGQVVLNVLYSEKP